MATGYETVHVSAVHQPPRASKAHPHAVTVKVDDTVHVLRFSTLGEAQALREQPVESIVATCEQLAAARAADSEPYASSVDAYADRVALLIGQEVFVRFDTPTSSHRRGQHATGVLASVDRDGVLVRFSPRSPVKRIPWAKLQYVALSNPRHRESS